MNQSLLNNFVRTDPGSTWFIYQLNSDPRLHDLKLLVLELFHFAFYFFMDYGELIPSFCFLN